MMRISNILDFKVLGFYMLQKLLGRTRAYLYSLRVLESVWELQFVSKKSP